MCIRLLDLDRPLMEAKQAGTPAYPGRVAYTGQTLSHSPLKKRGGGEKQSYLYEKLF